MIINLKMNWHYFGNISIKTNEPPCISANMNLFNKQFLLYKLFNWLKFNLIIKESIIKIIIC